MSSTLTDTKKLKEWYYDAIKTKNKNEGKEYTLDPELMNIFEESMPKSAVIGIGIDRLVMLLLNEEKISDTVCFDNSR